MITTIIVSSAILIFLPPLSLILIPIELFPSEWCGTLRTEIKFVPVLIDGIKFGAGLYSGAVGGGVFVTVVDIIAPVVRPVVRGVAGRIVII